MRVWSLPLLLLSVASPVLAAERGYSVTDFEKIDVVGPFKVIVETGRSPSARAIGDQAALDRLTVETRGRMLVIRQGANVWGGWPGKRPPAPTIRVTVPNVRMANLSGSGSIAINKVRAQTLQVGIAGSGSIAISAIDADKLSALVTGSGVLTLSGRAYGLTARNEGSGRIDAGGLTTQTLDLTSNSAGGTEVIAARTAKVVSTGSGNVTVSGKAACNISSVGSGEVSCGSGAAK